MFVKETIKSYNRTVYANIGDEVKIISSDAIVAIVETTKMNRFPCLVEMLSEDMVVVVVEEVEVIITDQLRLF